MLIKRVFSDNFMLKVIALGLAVLTWFAVNQITSHEKVVENIPIKVLVGESWSVQELKPDTLRITFRGSREDMAELDPSSVKVQIDLKETTEGEVHGITLTPRDVLFPGAGYPYEISPPTVYVRLDQISEKIVSVKANITGELSEGFRYEQSVASPEMVKLVGSRRRLEEIDSVQTAPIPLEGRIKSFTQRVALLPPSEEWIVHMDPNRVDVSVVLAGQDAVREFTNLTVNVMSLPGIDAPMPTLDPAAVSIRVEGRDTLVQSLKLEQFQAFVQVGERAVPSTNKVPIRVNIPAGLKLLEVIPAELSVITPAKKVEAAPVETDSPPVENPGS